MKTRVTLIGIVLLAVVTGCKGEGASGAPEPRGAEPAVTSAPAAGSVGAGAAGAKAEGEGGSIERVPSKCPEAKTVDAGGDATPEGVLWDAYRLALQPDSEGTATAFFRLFVTGSSPKHILDALWPRVREHVAKYIPDPARPAYVVCRRQEQSGGGVKIYVQSNDSRKSDPPTVLVKENGAWRIDVMTP